MYAVRRAPERLDPLAQKLPVECWRNWPQIFVWFYVVDLYFAKDLDPLLISTVEIIVIQDILFVI